MIIYPPIYECLWAYIGSSDALTMLDSCGALKGKPFNNTCVVATTDEGVATATGNLLWVMFNWFNVYKYRGYNQADLIELYPLLARTVTYYSHITNDNGPGTPLHINPTVSPEYGPASDTNYDLSLLKFGLSALLGLAEKGFTPAVKDGRLAMWKDMNERLVDYSVDNATGYSIGAGVCI